MARASCAASARAQLWCLIFVPCVAMRWNPMRPSRHPCSVCRMLRVRARWARLCHGCVQPPAAPLPRPVRAVVRCLTLEPPCSPTQDAESEAQVQGALDAAMAARDRTIIVIAHRLSTVRNADVTVVMDRGQVRAWGWCAAGRGRVGCCGHGPKPFQSGQAPSLVPRHRRHAPRASWSRHCRTARHKAASPPPPSLVASGLWQAGCS